MGLGLNVNAKLSAEKMKEILAGPVTLNVGEKVDDSQIVAGIHAWF